MTPFLAIAELTEEAAGTLGERFAVLAIDPTRRVGEGCEATVLSLHHSREAAQAEIDLEGRPR